MTKKFEPSKVTFCSDSQLLYNDYQTEFQNGQGLLFDESYRLAHLPLVAPNHPRVISKKDGTSYNQGIHDLVYSVVIPIYGKQLQASVEFNKLCDELRASGFADKLSWNTFSQRKDKLHATICGTISTKNPPYFDQEKYQSLRNTGPISVKVSGLFSGNKNIGRLYLKVYPERRAGENICHVIQRIFESPLTDLYVVGLFNFIDELNVEEANELEMLLSRWRDVEFMQLRLDELWLLKSRDDLVLNGSIDNTIPLV